MSERNDEEYPRDLKQATRAEYITLIRQYQKDRKKPGCPLMGLMILTLVTSLVHFVFHIF